MQRTKIEYLTYTWNPIAMRCTPVSDGCRNCWHLAMAKRLAKNPTIDRDAQKAYFGAEGPSMNYVELEGPLHLSKPSRIGVQFMGDLFHKDVSDRFIAETWDVMTRCPKHTFLILTKRPDRIQKWAKGWQVLPFPNIYLGVSVEDQKTADERIPILLQIPATKRFVSCEPLLGPLDLGRWLFCNPPANINWVIVGGETGPHARPIDLEWAHSLYDQCKRANVPFFFKQVGGNRETPPDLTIREFPV